MRYSKICLLKIGFTGGCIVAKEVIRISREPHRGYEWRLIFGGELDCIDRNGILVGITVFIQNGFSKCLNGAVGNRGIGIQLTDAWIGEPFRGKLRLDLGQLGDTVGELDGGKEICCTEGVKIISEIFCSITPPPL